MSVGNILLLIDLLWERNKLCSLKENKISFENIYSLLNFFVEEKKLLTLKENKKNLTTY